MKPLPITIKKETAFNKYFACINELPGVMAYGSTLEEAVLKVKNQAKSVAQSVKDDPKLFDPYGKFSPLATVNPNKLKFVITSED